MPRINFDNVTKSYGPVEVLKTFNVSVDDGEFLVLLGPSGCGKSTLLRMIAGLTDVTSGAITFDGEAINDWDVRRRNTAFVFQSYGLYPQMTVRQNIAFPMLMDRYKAWHHLPLVSTLTRRRLMRTPEISQKVEAIAEQLKLTPMLERRPAKLSGGQRQRVALARSLVREPSVYLLDEPLSNLDAKLRTQMRSDITSLHRTVGKTFIFVTHDQVEAMTMATTVIVMNDGLIQQVGTPDDIYDRPQNTFVAGFVGSPPMNLIAGALFPPHREAFKGDAQPEADLLARSIVGIRPEHVDVAPLRPEGLPAVVDIIERVGAETLIGCRLLDIDKGQPETDLIFARARAGNQLRIGERCSLRIDTAAVSWFDQSTGERLENGTAPAQLLASGSTITTTKAPQYQTGADLVGPE